MDLDDTEQKVNGPKTTLLKMMHLDDTVQKANEHVVYFAL
jgi:hypothetical protein